MPNKIVRRYAIWLNKEQINDPDGDYDGAILLPDTPNTWMNRQRIRLSCILYFLSEVVKPRGKYDA